MNQTSSPRVPGISVIMPSLNQAEYLQQAIESVLNQDAAAVELIVIDGGSTDGSVDIIRRYADRIAYWVSEPDRGQSHALNKGLQQATLELVGWLNSDDLYTPGTFSQVRSLFRDPDVTIAMSSRFGLMGASGQLFDVKENTFSGHSRLVRFWETNGMTINQPCVFFRRSVLDGMAPVFDTSLHYAMDYDLWLRLTLGNDIRVVEGQWANYRFHDTSKSGTGFGKFFPEWYAVSRRHWGKQYSRTWWAHWLGHLWYRYPRRLVAGTVRRLRGFSNG